MMRSLALAVLLFAASAGVAAGAGPLNDLEKLGDMVSALPAGRATYPTARDIGALSLSIEEEDPPPEENAPATPPPVVTRTCEQVFVDEAHKGRYTDELYDCLHNGDETFLPPRWYAASACDRYISGYSPRWGMSQTLYKPNPAYDVAACDVLHAGAKPPELSCLAVHPGQLWRPPVTDPSDENQKRTEWHLFDWVRNGNRWVPGTSPKGTCDP